MKLSTYNFVENSVSKRTARPRLKETGPHMGIVSHTVRRCPLGYTEKVRI